MASDRPWQTHLLARRDRVEHASQRVLQPGGGSRSLRSVISVVASVTVESLEIAGAGARGSGSALQRPLERM